MLLYSIFSFYVNTVLFKYVYDVAILTDLARNIYQRLGKLIFMPKKSFFGLCHCKHKLHK